MIGMRGAVYAAVLLMNFPSLAIAETAFALMIESDRTWNNLESLSVSSLDVDDCYGNEIDVYPDMRDVQYWVIADEDQLRWRPSGSVDKADICVSTSNYGSAKDYLVRDRLRQFLLK